MSRPGIRRDVAPGNPVSGDAGRPRGEATDRRPRCPTCRRPIEWRANPARPFCSATCKLIDLGGWLDNRYTIPGWQEESDVEPSHGAAAGPQDP